MKINLIVRIDRHGKKREFLRWKADNGKLREFSPAGLNKKMVARLVRISQLPTKEFTKELEVRNWLISQTPSLKGGGKSSLAASIILCLQAWRDEANERKVQAEEAKKQPAERLRVQPRDELGQLQHWLEYPELVTNWNKLKGNPKYFQNGRLRESLRETMAEEFRAVLAVMDELKAVLEPK